MEFAEALLANYPQGQWISRERERLTNAINRAINRAIDRVTGDKPVTKQRTDI
ncbi:hypothetical protein [Nonomuraea africana]|uniref:Uncharacterized protein n=1 Tax=Nonomuraea africana TaxID=46171 RepID=A0ABR9KJ40_9ACTN|nr:hypothetical protein [Nonomuraea africana]MBE1562036.1 hypothetical protein [Nonomuraea africana]